MGLSILRYVMKSSGNAGTTDDYKNAERFFETVLNLAYGLNLKNLNTLAPNYPAIDLGDPSAKICFQITGTNSSTKIKTTIGKFFSHKLNSKYNNLRFLILTNKKNYSRDFAIPVGFDFSVERDILDVDDLLAKIESGSDELISQIAEYVAKELSPILAIFAPSKSLFALVQPAISRPPANSVKLGKFLGVEEPDDFASLHSEIAKKYKKLAKLTREQREYLLTIVLRGDVKNYAGKRIAIAPNTVNGLFASVDPGHLKDIFDVVSDKGFADVPEGEYPVLIYLFWSNDFGGDMFYEFRRMFNGDEALLERLLVVGDFTLLDN